MELGWFCRKPTNYVPDFQFSHIQARNDKKNTDSIKIEQYYQNHDNNDLIEESNKDHSFIFLDYEDKDLSKSHFKIYGKNLNENLSTKVIA